MSGILALPLIIAGTLHMAAVKRNLCPGLNRPLNERLFGRNKTVRGMILMPLFSVLGLFITVSLKLNVHGFSVFHSAPVVPLGLALGISYVLSELPNSYLKRRLGIQPGKLPARNRLFFLVLDQADSAIGCVLVYACLIDVPIAALILCVALGPAVHLVANVSLYTLRLREQPF